MFSYINRRIEAERFEAGEWYIVDTISDDQLSLMQLTRCTGISILTGEDQWETLLQVEEGESTPWYPYVGDNPNDPDFIEAYHAGASCWWWAGNEHDHYVGPVTDALCEHNISLNTDYCLYCCAEPHA